MATQFPNSLLPPEEAAPRKRFKNSLLPPEEEVPSVPFVARRLESPAGFEETHPRLSRFLDYAAPVAEVLNAPLSQSLGGESFGSLVERIFPEGPAAGGPKGTTADIARLAAGLADFLQSPGGIAALTATVASGGAAAPYVFAPYAAQATVETPGAVKNYLENPTPENLQQALLTPGFAALLASASAPRVAAPPFGATLERPAARPEPPRPVRGLLPPARIPIVPPAPPDASFVRGVPAQPSDFAPRVVRGLLTEGERPTPIPVQAARLPEAEATLPEVGVGAFPAEVPFRIQEAVPTGKRFTPQELAGRERALTQEMQRQAEPLRPRPVQDLIEEQLTPEVREQLRESVRERVREAVGEEVQQAVSEATGVPFVAPRARPAEAGPPAGQAGIAPRGAARQAEGPALAEQHRSVDVTERWLEGGIGDRESLNAASRAVGRNLEAIPPEEALTEIRAWRKRNPLQAAEPTPREGIAPQAQPAVKPPSVVDTPGLAREAPSWLDELKAVGGEVHGDQTVTLYHATTKDKAAEIAREGILRRPSDAPDSYGVYFSSSKEVSQDYGDGTIVPVRVRLADLSLDDVFPGRRMDFTVPTQKGVYKPVSISRPIQVGGAGISNAPLAAVPFALRGEQARRPVAPEAVLPGMERVVEGQRAGAAKVEGERLAGAFARPLEERAGQGIEAAPLFRGTEAAGQRELPTEAPEVPFTRTRPLQDRRPRLNVKSTFVGLPRTTEVIFPDKEHVQLYELGRRIGTRTKVDVDKLSEEMGLQPARAAAVIDQAQAYAREIARRVKDSISGGPVIRGRSKGEPIEAPTIGEAMKADSEAVERGIARREGFYTSPKEAAERVKRINSFKRGLGTEEMSRLRHGTPSREEMGFPPDKGGGELFSNPVFSARFWEQADTLLREKITQPLAQKISRAVGKLPDGVQRWLLSDFGRFPEVKQVFQESRTEIGRVRSEADALERMWLRTKPTAEETVAAERILRGQPEDLNRLRPEQQAAVREIRVAAQRLTGERQSLGLSVRDEWLDGARHWWPNFFRKHLGQSIGGRLFGRVSGRAKPSRESLGSLKPRLSDRYWVADSGGDLVETPGGARAVFTSREAADSFVRDNSGFSVSYFQRGGRGLSRRAFPTLRERTAWVKKQGDNITARKLESRHLQVVEPMTFEQQVANGLVLDPKLNIALGWSRQAELLAKTRFLAKLGEMTDVVKDTPADGYVRLDELGFSIPASLAERNPAVARLRDGFVNEPLAKELAAFYGANSPFQIAYRVSEGELRKWVTYRNPWRHPRQIFENEFTTALTDSGAFLDKIDQGRAFREYARAAAGDRSVRWWKEYVESELISTDLIRGEFQTMWRGLSEAVGLKPNAPLSLTERMALWAEENPLARQLLKSDEFAQRAYRAEDQIYKWYRYRRYRNQGWTHEAAVRRVKDSYFDYNSADIPRIVRVANRYIPFWVNVSYQYGRIFANQLRDYPASTMLRLGVLWYAQAFVRDLMFQKSGLTEQDLDNLGDYGPKAWEFVLPWTDEEGRNLVLNLQWFIPFSEVALMRHAAITETPERGWSQLARRFVPMVGQPVATIATQRTAFGQPVLKGTENRREAAWKLARAAALSAMPAILGQYWERLFRNAEAGEATRRPLAEKALLEPALGRIERFNVEERIGLRQAIAAGRGRELSEEAGKLRGRLLRGQISGETFRREIRKLHARTSELDVVHPDTFAVVQGLEGNRLGEARAAFHKLLKTGYYASEDKALDAVLEIANRRERLAEMAASPLPEASAAARLVVEEVRRNGRASAQATARLDSLLERLPESDEEALLDWLEEQLRGVRRRRSPAAGVPFILPSVSGQPEL